MSKNIVVSKRGFHFTREAIVKMLEFGLSLGRNGANIAWGIASNPGDPPGTIGIALGGIRENHPCSSPDEVDGIPFYWVGLPADLEYVRVHCVDSKPDQPSSLIDLPAD